MGRFRSILMAAIMVLAAGILLAFWSEGQEQTTIHARYQKLTTALASGDTNAVLALIAPQYRMDFEGGRMMRMASFAVPLEPHSKIFILGKDATVWPSPNWYLCGVWPVGNTVEMIKVNGSWFFTGKVHLD